MRCSLSNYFCHHDLQSSCILYLPVKMNVLVTLRIVYTMRNKLELINTALGWIAVFSGVTGSGEDVKNEEAHNISGESLDELAKSALNVWGALEDDTDIVVTD